MTAGNVARAAIDFAAVFEAMPTPYLVMTPDLVIVGANAAYLATTGRTLAELVGRPVFEAFPGNPSDSQADGGVSAVQASFERARDTLQPDTMPLQEYDIPDGAGGFSKRFWSLISTPVLDGAGRCAYVLQRAEDITDFVRDQQRVGVDLSVLQRRILEVESDLFARSTELAAARAAEALSAGQLAALAAVALRLAGARSVDELVTVVTEGGLALVGSPGGAVAVRDGDLLRSVVSDGLGGETTQRTYAEVPVDGPLPVSVAARTGRPVLLPDREACLAFAPEMAGVVEATGAVAFASLPLRTTERDIGVLTVAYDAPQAFQPEDVELLTAFAAQCSQALDRIQTREAELRSARQLSALAGLALELGGAETLGELVAVAERGLAALGAQGGAVAVTDPRDPAMIRLVLSEGLGETAQQTFGLVPLDGPLPISVAARTRRPVLLHDAAEARALTAEMDRAIAETGCEAWLGLPLETGGRLVGSIVIGWAQPQAHLPEQVGTAVAFAAQIAQALDRLETRTSERSALAALAGTVEALQRSLLSEPPEPDHLQVAVRYLPAARQAQVGGDWYDSFVLADGRTALVIGDVTGHDSIAAAAMAQVRNVLRGVAHSGGGTPAQVLSGLDLAMRDLAIGTLATAVLATVEQVDGGRVLRWSNAGHPAPLLVRPDGSVEVLERPADLLLGVDPGARRADHLHLLQPGSTVLLYTDGLIERPGVPLDEGEAWLVGLLQEIGQLPLEQLCDRVLGELAGRVDDDVALLAIRAHREDRPRPAEAGPVQLPEGHSALR
ncbi:SpoIIE family protein phosphatase [Modestobacter sp. L9-4]|uniref:SpoIIE family protein phosphatase n=1 Tax=Modestobacter sp. L9-4 TaxID=2851567 RepID=UPI001C755D0B|nr:SpoIIE family protein phosphatase [Modestobacter sp. L9-4]QXG76784.1 SpoIIE family protein phosphatase [Modestobacter sp. L9-4]